jgi:hypothetical protein
VLFWPIAKIHHPRSYARDIESQRIPFHRENVAGIEVGEYPALNSRNPSGSNSKRKRRCFRNPDLSSLSLYSFEKRGENISHGISVDEILATLYFLLCVSVPLAVLGGW